ncbi:MAG: saccharopine dehydrogenase family protein [Chloroflexia bacterium]
MAVQERDIVRVLVLGGAGAVCSETTRDLVRTSDFEEIVIGELAVARAQALAQELGDPRVRVLPVDARDEEALTQFLRGFDVVVNGLPFRYDLPVTRAAVAAGVSGLDLSSEDPQFALHEEALRRGITFIPGMGATPGITNVMARWGVEQLDRVSEIDIAFAAFRCLAPAPGLLETTLWEFTPDEEERNETYYEDGRWHPAPPLSGEQSVRFHEWIGEQKVYLVPHDEVYSLPRSFPEVRRVAVRGCFPPHVMELMGALMRAGLLSQQPVVLGEQTLPAREVVRALLSAVPESRSNPIWGYGLVVEVRGEKDGRPVCFRYRNRHPPQERWGGPAAYYKNIGIPLSIGAQMLARGEVERKGVVPPEQAIAPEPFFAELARRGIEIEEERVEL